MDQFTAKMEASDFPDGIAIAAPIRKPIPRATTSPSVTAPANARQVVDSEPTSQATKSFSSSCNYTEVNGCIASNCKTWTIEQLQSEYKNKTIIFGDGALRHNPKYQVLLEVVNGIEFQTAISNMKEKKIQKVMIDGYPYYFGSWGSVPVVMIQTGEKMGSHYENGSNNRTRLALRSMPQIKYVFAVGVCGGVVDKDGDKINPRVKLGQVVISSHIIGYDHQKKKPGQNENRSFASNLTQNKFYQFLMRTDNSEDGTKFEQVFSGSWLVADADNAQKQLLDLNPQGVGIEMEGIGIASACQNSETKVECLVVKGVSDHAGVDKNDNWQPAAARNAVKYLSKMLNQKHEEDKQSIAGSNGVMNGGTAVNNGDTASDLSSPGGPQSTKPVQVTEANNNSNNNVRDIHLQQGASIKINCNSTQPMQPVTESKQSQASSDLVIPKDQARESAAINSSAKPATGVFVVYEHDEHFDECLVHFVEVLRGAGINCDMDQYHANRNITNWNIWCEEQIKKAANSGYILLVCSPQLHDKLNCQSANKSDPVKMRDGYINSTNLRPLLEESKCFDRIIPIIPNRHRLHSCVLGCLSTRSCYIFPFDELLRYKSVEEVQSIPDFKDLVSLVAKLTGQNLMPKPPVASQPPKLTKERARR
ncbi:uncharacterized protein [Dysidea avara]|uniref:uncharacterized protein isoform X3 n=1 Tax=Dysidea avara TaxID=196820 RepID=UPI00332CA71B